MTAKKFSTPLKLKMFEFDPDSDDSLLELIGPTLSRQSSSSFERVVRQMAEVDENVETVDYPPPVALLLQALNSFDWFDSLDDVRGNYLWHVQQRDQQLQKNQFRPHSLSNPAISSNENFVFETAIDRALNTSRFREEILPLDIDLELIMRDSIRTSPCWSTSQILRVESLSCMIAILCSPIVRIKEWLETDEDCWDRLCHFASLPCIVNAPQAHQIDLILAVCWDMVFCSVNLPGLFFSTEERLGVVCRLSSRCRGRIPLLYVNTKEVTAPYMLSQRPCLLVDELAGVAEAGVASEQLVAFMKETLFSPPQDSRYPGEAAVKFWLDKFHTAYLNKEHRKTSRSKNSANNINSATSNQRSAEEQAFITIVASSLTSNEFPSSYSWLNHPLAQSSLDGWLKQALSTFHLVYSAAAMNQQHCQHFQTQLGSTSLYTVLGLPFILSEGNMDLGRRFVSGYLWGMFIVQSSDLTPRSCPPTVMLRLLSRLVSRLEDEGSTGGHESRKTAGLHMTVVTLFAMMGGGVANQNCRFEGSMQGNYDGDDNF